MRRAIFKTVNGMMIALPPKNLRVFGENSPVILDGDARYTVSCTFEEALREIAEAEITNYKPIAMSTDEDQLIGNTVVLQEGETVGVCVILSSSVGDDNIVTGVLTNLPKMDPTTPLASKFGLREIDSGTVFTNVMLTGHLEGDSSLHTFKAVKQNER